MCRCKSIVVICGMSGLMLVAHVRAQVEIPEGFEVVEVFRSNRLTTFPDINECGEIVFDSQMGRDQKDREIFLYDNEALRRITNNNVRDRLARLNNLGEIVWNRTIVEPDDDQVVLWRLGEEIILDSSTRKPELLLGEATIGDDGWVVWGRGQRAGFGCEGDLLLWDGETERKLTQRDRFWEHSPEINAVGDIVWQSMDVCANPWTAEIRLFSNGQTNTLPSSFVQVQLPALNDIGQVAWTGDWSVELWEGGLTSVLTDNGRGPKLNNQGDVLFYRWHDDIGQAQIWLYRPEPNHFYRLVDEWQANHSMGDLNEWSEAAWAWTFGPEGREFGIMQLRRTRTGESDFDGTIDLADYTAFADCMTGPVRTDHLCDCRFLDIDYDGDVDLGDFARFQNAYQGP